MMGLSASLALGAIIGVALLILGETAAEINLTLDFAALDGLWFFVGVPVATTLVLLLLSPVSFGIYRLIAGRRGNQAPQDR